MDCFLHHYVLQFGVISRLDFYDDDCLAQIILRSARILDVSIDKEGANQLAKRSRGMVAVANRLLKQCA